MDKLSVEGFFSGSYKARYGVSDLPRRRGFTHGIKSDHKSEEDGETSFEVGVGIPGNPSTVYITKQFLIDAVGRTKCSLLWTPTRSQIAGGLATPTLNPI